MSDISQKLRSLSSRGADYDLLISQAADLIERQQEQININVDMVKQLQQERDALAAHNERYRIFVEKFCEKVPDTPETHWIYPSVMTLKRATRFTPQTSLAEVRARAVEEAAEALYKAGVGPANDSDWLTDYANKIRNNGKDGE